MKERGILFSAPMVRALLAGTKTQTRRLIALPFRKGVLGADGWRPFDPADDADRESMRAFCPQGRVGDRLWVRETWAGADFMCGGEINPPQTVAYRADRTAVIFDPETLVAQPAETRGWNWEHARWKWRPSIFMPRWASRITREITDVRVERLQDISEADAQAEGMPHHDGDPGPFGPTRLVVEARKEFRHLWDAINGKRPGASWDANPWVWAITMKPIEVP